MGQGFANGGRKPLRSIQSVQPSGVSRSTFRIVILAALSCAALAATARAQAEIMVMPTSGLLTDELGSSDTFTVVLNLSPPTAIPTASRTSRSTSTAPSRTSPTPTATATQTARRSPPARARQTPHRTPVTARRRARVAAARRPAPAPERVPLFRSCSSQSPVPGCVSRLNAEFNRA